MAAAIWLVVVNYGSHGLIDRNLAVAEAHRSGGGVVVVDNYSSDAEREAASSLCHRRRWTLVPMEDNPGFAAACNAGVRAAVAEGAERVLLVNPDAVVQPHVVQALAEQLAEDPLVVVAPQVVTSDGRPYFRGSRVDLRSGRMRSRQWPEGVPPVAYLKSTPPLRDWLTGACLAFSVELWRTAGGLDEGYFLYWEDVDFSQRCVEAGARLCLRGDLVVEHDEGATHGTQGSRARSAIYYHYNCRNRLVYGARHLSRPQLLWWILRTPAESWQILLRGGRRQLLQSRAPLVATLKGSLAGLGQAGRALIAGNGRPHRWPGPSQE